MNTATGALATLRRLIIVIAVAIVFVFGLATTVYLSLRSPEVKVPDVVGKDRFEAERVLGDASLNFRVRAIRPTAQMKADTVLFQLPRAGEVVKAGQTVAMDISRPVKEGEASEAVPTPEEKPTPANANESASANDNKPKRNKNTNKNTNENANGNDNAGNRNANTNRLSTNKNTNGNTSGTNANTNRPPLVINSNANHSSNQNSNVRPAAPKPSPVAKPTQPNP